MARPSAWEVLGLLTKIYYGSIGVEDALGLARQDGFPEMVRYFVIPDSLSVSDMEAARTLRAMIPKDGRMPSPFDEEAFRKGFSADAGDVLLRAFPSGITRMRVGRGLKQTELARAIGVSQSQLSRWERGADLRVGTLKKIAAVLGCSLDDLV